MAGPCDHVTMWTFVLCVVGNIKQRCSVSTRAQSIKTVLLFLFCFFVVSHCHCASVDPLSGAEEEEEAPSSTLNRSHPMESGSTTFWFCHHIVSGF